MSTLQAFLASQYVVREDAGATTTTATNYSPLLRPSVSPALLAKTVSRLSCALSKKSFQQDAESSSSAFNLVARLVPPISRVTTVFDFCWVGVALYTDCVHTRRDVVRTLNKLATTVPLPQEELRYVGVFRILLLLYLSWRPPTVAGSSHSNKTRYNEQEPGNACLAAVLAWSSSDSYIDEHVDELRPLISHVYGFVPQERLVALYRDMCACACSSATANAEANATTITSGKDSETPLLLLTNEILLSSQLSPYLFAALLPYSNAFKSLTRDSRLKAHLLCHEHHLGAVAPLLLHRRSFYSLHQLTQRVSKSDDFCAVFDELLFQHFSNIAAWSDYSANGNTSTGRFVFETGLCAAMPPNEAIEFLARCREFAIQANRKNKVAKTNQNNRKRPPTLAPVIWMRAILVPMFDIIAAQSPYDTALSFAAELFALMMRDTSFSENILYELKHDNCVHKALIDAVTYNQHNIGGDAVADESCPSPGQMLSNSSIVSTGTKSLLLDIWKREWTAPTAPLIASFLAFNWTSTPALAKMQVEVLNRAKGTTGNELMACLGSENIIIDCDFERPELLAAMARHIKGNSFAAAVMTCTVSSKFRTLYLSFAPNVNDDDFGHWLFKCDCNLPRDALFFALANQLFVVAEESTAVQFFALLAQIAKRIKPKVPVNFIVPLLSICSGSHNALKVEALTAVISELVKQHDRNTVANAMSALFFSLFDAIRSERRAAGISAYEEKGQSRGSKSNNSSKQSAEISSPRNLVRAFGIVAGVLEMGKYSNEDASFLENVFRRLPTPEYSFPNAHLIELLSLIPAGPLFCHVFADGLASHVATAATRDNSVPQAVIDACFGALYAMVPPDVAFSLRVEVLVSVFFVSSHLRGAYQGMLERMKPLIVSAAEFRAAVVRILLRVESESKVDAGDGLWWCTVEALIRRTILPSHDKNKSS